MSQTKRKSRHNTLTKKRKTQTRSKRGGNMIEDFWQKTSSLSSSTNWNPMNWMKKKETPIYYTPTTNTTTNTTTYPNNGLSGGKKRKTKKSKKSKKNKRGGNNCGGGYGSGLVQGVCLPDNVEPYIRESDYSKVSGYSSLS